MIEPIIKVIKGHNSYKYSRTGLVIKHKEDVSPNFS